MSSLALLFAMFAVAMATSPQNDLTQTRICVIMCVWFATACQANFNHKRRDKPHA